MGFLPFLGVLFLGTWAIASGCQEGHRSVIRGTQCTAYQECDLGKTVLKICKPGYIFDTRALACLHHSETSCSDTSAECDSSALYAHHGSCRLYYSCIGKRIVTKFCPAGEIFDSEIKACRHGLSCDNDICKEGSRRSVEGETTHYDKCENGKWVRKVCNDNSYFDQESLACKVKSNNCKGGQTIAINCAKYLTCKDSEWVLSTCPLGETFDGKTNQCIPGNCSHRQKRSAGLCDEGRKRRVEGSCKKYTECVDGEEVERSCSPCMNFDDSTSSCRYVFSVPCPNPPPPVPTDPPITLPPTTEAPVTTDKPVTTEEPVTTDKPVTTEEPVTTDKPVTTEAPVTTDKPVTTEAPVTTDKPVTTEAPVTTDKPATTEAPVTTDKPATTEEPVTTDKPATTEEPVTTNKPATTEAPTTDPKPNPPNSIPTRSPGTTSVPNTTTGPKCKDGERKAIPGDCKSYLECLYGKFYTNRCNYFQHFDSLTLDCRVFGYNCAS